MKLIILQGPPASGKTTWTKNYLDSCSEKERNNTVVVSRDTIRDATGTYWVPSREDYITELEDHMIEGALSRGMDVIIDATNLNPKTLQRLQAFGAKYQATEILQKFYVPFAEALERDKNRERSVGEKVLRHFYEYYYKEQYRNEVYVDHRLMKDIHTNKPKCVMCDIDGTIAIHTSGRTAFEYNRVGEDTPDKRLVCLLNNLILDKEKPVDLIFISGREDIGDCRKLTEQWLQEAMGHNFFTLYMRQKDDHRPDQITKKELYEKHIKDQYDVICVFDDRDKVVKMWREEGLLCNQVYYGDF